MYLRAQLQVVIGEDLHQSALIQAGEAYSVGRLAIILYNLFKVTAQEITR